MPAEMSTRAFVATLALTLAVGAALAVLDPPGGMVAFELAGDAERAASLLAGWSPAVRERVGFSLGLDFLFLALYPAALSGLCARLARGARAPLARIGPIAAGLVWIAAPLDAIENVALLQQLMRGASDAAARIALACAAPKFALVAGALGFVVVAGASRLIARRPGEPLALAEEEWSLRFADQLEDRLYEFNVSASGFADGRGLAFAVRDAAGALVAGLAGHTWGGTCEVKQLWVDEARRGRGLGSALLARAIREAEARGCTQLLLSTHSFQAPGFYARHGFRELFRAADYPRGHAQIFLLRELSPPGR